MILVSLRNLLWLTVAGATALVGCAVSEPAFDSGATEQTATTEQAVLTVCDGPEDLGQDCATGKVCTATSSCVSTAACYSSATGPGIVTGNVTVDGTDTAGDLALLTDAWCVTGSLTVTNTALTDLSALSRLLAVGNALTVQQNTQLTSLHGLEAFQRAVSIKVVANSNTGFTNLQGLSGLRALSSLEVVGNAWLTSLNGVAAVDVTSSVNLTGNGRLLEVNALSGIVGSMFGYITVQNEAALRDLSGFSNVTSVGSVLRIFNSDSVTDLTGLHHITRVGGELYVALNDNLPNLNGLAAVTQVGSARIQSNPKLDECAVTALLARTGASAANSSANAACTTVNTCRVAACQAGACTEQLASVGTLCAGGACDAAGICASPVKLEIWLVSDGSVSNPPATRNQVWNPGDRITFNTRLVNDGATTLTQVSSVRISSADPNVVAPGSYSINGNQVAPGAKGYAYPGFVIANDAPEGQTLPVTVEVDFLENGQTRTLRAEKTIVVGPGEPNPGVPLTLELIDIGDGHYSNTPHDHDGHLAPGELITAAFRARNWTTSTFSMQSRWIEHSDPFVTQTSITGFLSIPARSMNSQLGGQVTLSPDTPVGHVFRGTIHAVVVVDGTSFDATLPIEFEVSSP